MKFSEQIKLAVYNLSRRKKTSKQCIVMTTIIMLLVCFCSFFITTLRNQLKDRVDNYISTNYIEIDKRSNDQLPDEKQVLDAKNKFSDINEVYYFSMFMPYQPTYVFTISLDGVSFGSSEDTVLWATIMKKDRARASFAKNAYTEFDAKFDGQEIIKYGRDIKNEGEILFPEELLDLYELTKEQVLDADEFIFGFMSNGDHLLSGKVVGIINKNYSKIGNLSDVMDDVYFVADNNAKTDYYELDDYVRFYLDDTSRISAVRNFLNIEYDFITTYGNQSMQNRLELTGKILVFMQNIIVILFGAIGLALIFFLYSVINYNMGQKGNYLGMMRAMGLKSTLWLSLIEMTALTCLSAMICAILFIPIILLLDGAIIPFSLTSKYILSVNGGLLALTFFLSFAAILLLNIGLILISTKFNMSKSIAGELRK